MPKYQVPPEAASGIFIEPDAVRDPFSTGTEVEISPSGPEMKYRTFPPTKLGATSRVTVNFRASPAAIWSGMSPSTEDCALAAPLRQIAAMAKQNVSPNRVSIACGNIPVLVT